VERAPLPGSTLLCREPGSSAYLPHVLAWAGQSPDARTYFAAITSALRQVETHFRGRCDAASVPGVDSMETFLQAAAEFAVADLELQAEPSAGAAARRSLDDSGLLLLGEVHGVRENPLLIRALMRMLG
jgi:hypothetical protein